MNTQNENENNLIVKVMSYIVDTLARTLVTLFDGLKHAVDLSLIHI